MFCGNGGSAADSQHLATELLIRLRGSVERDSWPALALTLDPAMLTACGNDYGYERVFERPLRGLGRRGDVLFGITTSGRSPNVVRALAAAREMGIVTVGLLGGAGEPALGHCDHRPAGAGRRDGAHPGMPHRARPRGAGIARGPSGRASDRVTVLLTGAAGFIGYHVAEALLARGDAGGRGRQPQPVLRRAAEAGAAGAAASRSAGSRSTASTWRTVRRWRRWPPRTRIST